jgi:hypothetical protein
VGFFYERPTKTKNTGAAPLVEMQVVEMLYPNPTTGIVNILFGSLLTNASVSILDITGKVVLQKRVSGKHQQLNLFGLASGVYVVKVSNRNKAFSMKVIKA